MRTKQKAILFPIYIIGFIVSYIVPLFLVGKNLIIGQEPAVKYSIATGVSLFLVFIIYSKYIVKIFNRKLQAVAVADEIGARRSTNFVLVRLMKTIEIILPLAGSVFILYAVLYVTIPVHLVLIDMIIFYLIGFIILMVHDGIKTHFINENIVQDAIDLDRKKIQKIDKINRKMERK